MFSFRKQAVILFSFALVFIFACRDNIKEIDDLMQKQNVFPSEEGEMVEILYTDSGLVRVRITAPVMNHYTYNVPEPYTEMPKGVFIEFFNDSGVVKATMKAKYGIRYERTKRTQAKDKVEVVNVNGEILNTDKLDWNETTHKIFTDVPVKIITKKDVLLGSGMEANEDFTEYEISNPSGTSQAPGEEKSDSLKKD